MKNESIALGLIGFSMAIHTCDLARCKEYQCAFLIIIGLTAIHQTHRGLYSGKREMEVGQTHFLTFGQAT